MTKIFFLRILILYGAISFAQDSIVWNSKKDKIKIPFELSHNLIIVDVIFNGVKLKMIADTGAEKNILFAFPEKDSITLNKTSKMKVSGVGIGEAIEAYISNSNKLQINDEIIYQTKLGTRVYIVTEINQISENDLSVLEKSNKNILTLITCVKDKKNLRLCVQASEKV